MDLARRRDETKLAYHKRLVYGKLVDKTLADIDYSEIAEALYGKPYSSDVARRMIYGSRLTLDTIGEEACEKVSAESVLSELEAKRVEIQKERQKFFDQRREYNKLVSGDARWEHLCDMLRKSVDNLDVMSCAINTSGMQDIRPADTCGNEAVLVLSDWHYGMVADNVFNKYNTDICKERVSHVVRKTIERIVLHGCSKLHVVVLGDLIHGGIHAGARVMSEELVCDQLIHVSEILANAICTLSEYVDDTFVYMTYGNHARTIQSKGDSVHRDNMERIVPWWLKERFKGYSNISVDTQDTDEFVFVESCGYEFCASHGDLDSVKSSPRLLSTLFQKKYGMDIDYVLLGDKHHRESFEELGIASMLCGALCGADDYANEHRLYSDPSQLLLIVSEDCGVDAEYRIKC